MATAYLITNDFIKFRVLVRNKRPSNTIAVVPQSIDPSDYPYVKGVQVDDGFGSLIWEAVVDPALQVSGQKNKDKKIAYDSYLSDVNQEMMLTFGTLNREKATSLYLTWVMMQTQPEFYSDKGLFDDKGRALDTNTKVYDYASLKVMRALDYSVFLMAREKQYIDELTAIG